MSFFARNKSETETKPIDHLKNNTVLFRGRTPCEPKYLWVSPEKINRSTYDHYYYKNENEKVFIILTKKANGWVITECKGKSPEQATQELDNIKCLVVKEPTKFKWVKVPQSGEIPISKIRADERGEYGYMFVGQQNGKVGMVVLKNCKVQFCRSVGEELEFCEEDFEILCIDYGENKK